ncbi:MAG: ABC transporter permease [Cyanobacteria bacterium PR.3.49]|nr:ABC transporter permease [Cyanobacteria bacterium PR.3.49]
MNIIRDIKASRLISLILKEAREIMRNPYLLFLILVPPTIQLLILGGALDPQVRHLSLATVDHAQTQQSRDLVASLTTSGVFPKNVYLPNEDALLSQLEKGALDVGMVIPKDFSVELNRNNPADVQILVDGADAYTAGIARAYVLRTIHDFTPQGKKEPRFTLPSAVRTDKIDKAEQIIDPKVDILYNPNQESSWFFIPGILGACLTLTGTLVASATVLKERERGTMEQLLMTPAAGWEILLAKIIPLVTFLIGDVLLAIFAAQIIFHMPFRGNLFLFLFASALYAFVGIGFGMLLGSICHSQRQAQLASFFINIPLILLSGTVVPLDTMPPVMQAISIFDPLRYYTLVARGVILKGATFSMLWQEVALLAFAAALILVVSANRFRRQLI